MDEKGWHACYGMVLSGGGGNQTKKNYRRRMQRVSIDRPALDSEEGCISRLAYIC